MNRTAEAYPNLNKLLLLLRSLDPVGEGVAMVAGRVPWSGGFEGVVVTLSDVLELVARS